MFDLQRDLKHLWHPCTQMKDHEWLPMVPIRSGKGVWLEDYDGNQYIDAISSWWVNLFGHAREEIVEAIHHQAQTLEHVLLAGFTHEPVVRLSERLVGLTPEALTRCFFADNGSAAVEVALKMSYHYWRNNDKPNKSRFVCLQNSYHGETLGALAVGDVALYKETYEPLLMQAISVPSPDAYRAEAGQSAEDFARQEFAHMERLLSEQHDEIAAVIVEPLVQCAGSMRMYDPEYLRLLRDACDRYGVHFIADEIAVGFGRTGTLWATEQASVTPDFLCMSKGITGGFLPLAVVMTRENIYDAFYDDYQNLTAFLHSHSYTGNPIACAAANATLDIFENDRVIDNNQRLIQRMAEKSQALKNHPKIGDVRQTGTILAVEMVQDKQLKTPYPWQERRGLRIYQHGLKNRVLLRPLGNVSYMMPPYVINDDELDLCFKVMEEGIDLATQD